ncbi:MAG: choice-of-anchor Q domain-containing protein [Kofleriaceae bacterium]
MQAALDDVSCAMVGVAAGTFEENLTISRDVRVIGVGTEPTILDGQQRGSVVTVLSGAVVLEDVVIQNGLATEGGGILNHGSLTLRGVHIEGNSARAAVGRGGGVYSDGASLTLEQTTISNNTASSDGTGSAPGAAGAGLYQAGGSVQMGGGAITSNAIRTATGVSGFVAKGAGVASEGAAVIMEDAEVRANQIDIDGHPGDALAYGAGIHLASGGLALTRSRIADNRVVVRGMGVEAAGAGIHATELSMTNSAVQGNTMQLFGDERALAMGGGIYSSGNAASTLTSSTVRANEIVLQCPVEGQVAMGGGIMLEGLGSLTLSGTKIDDNRLTAPGVEHSAKGGGIAWQPSQIGNSGKLTIVRSTLASNVVTSSSALGVGAFIRLRSPGHEVSISQSTLHHNQGEAVEAAWGGGVFYEALHPNGVNELLVVNSTLSGNTIRSTGTSAGGGLAARVLIHNGGRIRVASSTVTLNSASGSQRASGGVDASQEAEVVLANSIVAANSGTSRDLQCDDPGATLSLGYNLFGTTNGCALSTVLGDQVGSPLMLESLADNGGPTWTHALLAGSAALDAANPQGCVGPDGVLLTEDQRGMPRVTNLRCDIGSYER